MISDMEFHGSEADFKISVEDVSYVSNISFLHFSIQHVCLFEELEGRIKLRDT